MPPALAIESENESSQEEEIISPHQQSKKENDEEMVDVKGDVEEEEEAGDEDDEESEVYVVEKIISHDLNFDDGEPRYEIKWLGYEKKSERTWEVEGNLAGAKELLKEYWKMIGGKPVPKAQATKASSTGKKRGRQSIPKEDIPETAMKKQKLQSRGGRKSGGGAKSKSLPELPPDVVNVEDDWDPPKATEGAWENDVMQVDTIEGDDKDERWAYLVWSATDANGNWRRTRAKLSTCYVACPQRMLKFYEEHLVFTDSRDSERVKKEKDQTKTNGA